MKIIKIVGILLLIAWFASWISFFGPNRYPVHVGGPYQLARAATIVVLVNPDHPSPDPIGGDIQKFAINPPYLTAYYAELTYPRFGEPKVAYLLLNTKTDECKVSLSEEQWRSELKRIGWINPDLKEPPPETFWNTY